MKNIKIAVLGGGGRTGKYLVNQLLEQGFSINLLLRTPEDFIIQHSQIEIVKGDAIDENAIRLLLEGCQAVMSTIGQRPGEPLVAGRATTQLLKTMQEYNIKRYVLLAGLNIDTPFDNKSEKSTLATNWMKTHYPEIQKDRQLTYDLLNASAIDWTLVRVPFIEFTDISSEVAISLEDCQGDKISAHAIADFMIKEVIHSEFSRKAPFISSI